MNFNKWFQAVGRVVQDDEADSPIRNQSPPWAYRAKETQ